MDGGHQCPQEEWLCLSLEVLGHRRIDSANVPPCLASLLRVWYLSNQPLSPSWPSGGFCFDITSCARLWHTNGNLHCCLVPTAA